MTRQEAKKIKDYCTKNGYKLVTYPGTDTFRAFRHDNKSNGSRSQIRVVSLMCYPQQRTVEVTVTNHRRGLNGLTDAVEVRRSIESLEDLVSMEAIEDDIAAMACIYLES